jgi:hypothetical protein
VITYINPAIAVSLGVAALGERVTPTMLLAFGTILAGSVLATRQSGRQDGATTIAQPAAGRSSPAAAGRGEVPAGRDAVPAGLDAVAGGRRPGGPA